MSELGRRPPGWPPSRRRAGRVERHFDDVLGGELVLAPPGRRDQDDVAQADRQVAFGGDDQAARPEADAGRHDRGARHVEVVHAVMMADAA